MKFTSEDLMKAMGLRVGDRVKAPNGVIYEVVSEVVDNINVIGLINKGKYEDNYFPLKMLVCDEDFEILPRPKRIGNLKCEECICDECPLRCTRCEKYIYDEIVLYDILEGVNSDYKDQEIHDLLKARLDKEVVEE